MTNDEITVDSSGWDKFFLPAVTDSTQPVEARIVTKDPEVKRYWATLEFGSREGSKPWPTARKKTRRRNGRVVSRQAPEGFVRKNYKLFYAYLKDAYARRVAMLKRPLRRAELAEAANESIERALLIEKSQIPVDTARAKNSLQIERAK